METETKMDLVQIWAVVMFAITAAGVTPKGTFIGLLLLAPIYLRIFHII